MKEDNLLNRYCFEIVGVSGCWTVGDHAMLFFSILSTLLLKYTKASPPPHRQAACDQIQGTDERRTHKFSMCRAGGFTSHGSSVYHLLQFGRGRFGCSL
jgi:hypothetical protein